MPRPELIHTMTTPARIRRPAVLTRNILFLVCGASSALSRGAPPVRTAARNLYRPGRTGCFPLQLPIDLVEGRRRRCRRGSRRCALSWPADELDVSGGTHRARRSNAGRRAWCAKTNNATAAGACSRSRHRRPDSCVPLRQWGLAPSGQIGKSAQVTIGKLRKRKQGDLGERMDFALTTHNKTLLRAICTIIIIIVIAGPCWCTAAAVAAAAAHAAASTFAVVVVVLVGLFRRPARSSLRKRRVAPAGRPVGRSG